MEQILANLLTDSTVKPESQDTTTIPMKQVRSALSEIGYAFDDNMIILKAFAETLYAGGEENVVAPITHIGRVLEALIQNAERVFEDAHNKCVEDMGIVYGNTIIDARLAEKEV